MARGFESKDVEYQQAEADRSKVLRPPMTAEEKARASRVRDLELSLARARADLQRAHVCAHRAMLERAIETLESELASLN